MTEDPHSDSLAERVPEIFAEALEIESAQERTAYVEKACEGDLDLIQMVTDLLAHHSGAQDYFKEPSPTRISAVEITQALSSMSELFENMDSVLPDDDEVGKQIGNYKLLQKIGEGGCGNVYLAQQEKPVRRQVALKIIKLGMDTKSVIARFEAERQALALMEHPNIAHVLNAGATETGRPYFVMELVHGVRITAYCDENQLSIPQRLSLFIQVCHAIQHAHQKGIIHRDIKPSNVLITLHDRKPVPKVIDFGIAKATKSDLLDDVTFHTVAAEPLMGTPAYMSPEQADDAHVDIDMRTDIYSLGALLYELLCGKPPFEQKELMKSGIDEMRRILREQDPPRPSVRVMSDGAGNEKGSLSRMGLDSRRLSAVLSSDLDWIVMKALEKDRQRRYETADGLAMDVLRYIENEPVMARPPSRVYRLQKLVRRNRAAFAGAAVVSLALLASATLSTWMFFRERTARLEQERLRLEQARMHKAEEDREKLSEAMILFVQGRWSEADSLVDGVAPSEVTFAYAKMFRSLAGWNAGHGRWGKAGARMAPVTQIADPKMLERTLDLLRYGPLLVKSGDKDGFDGLRRWAVSMYGESTEPIDVERVIKLCGLVPADEALLIRLEPMARFVEQSFEQEMEKPDRVSLAWRAFSLSLIKYRLGNYEGALAMCSKSLSISTWNNITVDSVKLVRAMAYYQLGRHSQARAELLEVRPAVDDHSFAGAAEVSLVWFDWVFADILLQEASELIQP